MRRKPCPAARKIALELHADKMQRWYDRTRIASGSGCITGCETLGAPFSEDGKSPIRAGWEGCVMGRVVCWFSCGDTSAVATKLALKQYEGQEIVVARIVIPSEHPDNDRFSDDCERWFGQPVVKLRSDEYTDTWDVWQKRRYIAGVKGAPCTTYLKKAVRDAFQEADDIQVFGFDAAEANRAAKFRKNNFEINLATPLIDRGLSKDDCHNLVRAAGIDIPVMYRLGFDNNNCVGCPKGGAGYWNRIRVHFPEVFARMSALERELGAKLIKLGGKHISLDELDPTAGRQGKEPRISCDLLCQALSDELEAA